MEPVSGMAVILCPGCGGFERDHLIAGKVRMAGLLLPQPIILGICSNESPVALKALLGPSAQWVTSGPGGVGQGVHGGVDEP